MNRVAVAQELVKVARLLTADEASDKVFARDWSDRLIKLLKEHKVAGFDGRVMLHDIKNVSVSEDMVDVTAKLTVQDLSIEFYFFLRNEGSWNGPARWETGVGATSPNKRGILQSKLATGRNATPGMAVKLMDDIMLLKYGKKT